MTPEDIAARMVEDERARNAAHIADVEASVRRIGAATGTSRDASVYGAWCANDCGRWCAPADKAGCAHESPVCEACYPNGCAICEQLEEENLRHREDVSQRINHLALEIRTSADDLSEADLRLLDWRLRNDVARHVGLAIEALRRVADVLNAQGGGRL